MRQLRLKSAALLMFAAAALVFTSTVSEKPAYCQETTGGLQGTVKDPSGAVVPKAKVILSSTAMVGNKELITDSSGYYRFANLPPGTYMLTVTAQGFKTQKRDGINIGIGRLPTLDMELQVGAESTTVEVSTEAPVIDVTTTQNISNVDSEALQNLPTGTTFQSVIQFAPMARNEPLAGLSVAGQGTGGTGGSLPGSSGNGSSFGYSIGGAADSETAYLVEGQDTENISGGYSKANVPMEFIQEVQMKTSGVTAEYGGALGGVVNVVMKKGSNQFHGEIFSTYESSGLDANPVNAYTRYDPNDGGTVCTPDDVENHLCDTVLRVDPVAQIYQPQKSHFRNVYPGITVGGPILKDRLVFFAGFNPQINTVAKTVDFGSSQNNAGRQYFTQDRQTYYGNLRLDYTVTSKIRVFGSWLNQYGRETGANLPISDPIKQTAGYLNTSISSPLTAYSHGLGWSAPNATYNVGADVSLTQKLVATTRYGYFFENYHDFGWPTSAPDLVWRTNGSGVNGNDGKPLPPNLQIYNGQPASAGTSTTPYLSSYTLFNANKHYQFNQDLAFFKSGWGGTHNLRFGYQLNHLVNVISQNGNVPYARMYLGANGYSPLTTTGAANCKLLKAEWGKCTGQYGYLRVQDFATVLPEPAADWNHALYVQDSWNVGKGLTFDLGLRIEKESLPAPGGLKVSAIDFNWSDKIEPRLGVAWDPTHVGKSKLFGSYGVVNDVMKLLLAQTSFGAQAYELCLYPLGPNGAADGSGFKTSDINLVFKGGRACPSAAANVGANFAGDVPPNLVDKSTGVSVIENVNLRPWEPVAPGVKPYRQHEYVAGFDYQLRPSLAFEVRYDRRRLDHVIEDASLSDPDWGETYTIINPGEGVNRTIDSYAAYLKSIGEAFGVPGWAFDADPSAPFGTCPSCPPNAKAVRNYDGIEFRLMMTPTRKLSGMFSYTYSSLWGNYTGLTTTDQSDGGTSTGRDSPDTTRSFDEPYYYFGANGKSNNGALPTDRPNVLKGYVYYTLPSWRHQSTSVGLFQQFLQGSPVASYADVGGASAGGAFEGVYMFGRDKWVDMTTDAAGNITLGSPRSRRTPWYTQSDLNLSHDIKVGDHQNVKFEATALNVLNQRAIAAFVGSMDSWNFSNSINPSGADLTGGAANYQAFESAYNPQALINENGVVKNSQYGQPLLYQPGRSVRLAVRFSF